MLLYSVLGNILGQEIPNLHDSYMYCLMTWTFHKAFKKLFISIEILLNKIFKQNSYWLNGRVNGWYENIFGPGYACIDVEALWNVYAI